MLPYMDDFINYLNTIVKLDYRAECAIRKITIERRLPRRALIQAAGAVCHEFHFMVQGAARVFYYKNDNEVTAWFGFETDLVSAIDSLFTQQPTVYNVELLEESVICSIQYQLMEPVFAEFPSVERLGRLLITGNYLKLDERMKMMMFHSAEERYELVQRQFPGILNRVSLKHIASYLNITQAALSRIRATTI